MTTDSRITLRSAHRDDVDAIHDMIKGLARSTGQLDRVGSSPGDFLRYGFGDDPLFEAVLAEKDGHPVGLVLFYFTFSTWLGEPGVYVSDIFVDPSLRGSGLGRRLLAAAATRGQQREATHLRLIVEASNLPAQSFYERVGMGHRTSEQTWHIGGEAYRQLAGEPQ